MEDKSCKIRVPLSPRYSRNSDNLQLRLMSQQKGKTSLAYARLGKTASKCKPSDEANTLCEFEQSPGRDENMQPTTSNIYDEILGEMALEHNKYISGLVVTNSRNRLGKSLTKEPKLSGYRLNLADDDELLYAASARQLQALKPKCNNSPEGLEEEISRFNSSRQNSHRSNSRNKFFGETAQKYRKNQVVTTNFETPRDNSKEHEPEFLAFLDSYVSVLSQSGKKSDCQQRSRDREKEKEQAKMARKLEMYEKKFKEMQLSNHMEVKKMKKRELYMRGKLQELQEHVGFLTSELERERQQRRKLESFFNEFRTKLSLMRTSDKKLLGKHCSLPQAYEFTEPDELMDSFDQYSSTSSYQDPVFTQTRSSQTSKNSDSRNKKANNFFKTKRDGFGKMDGPDLDMSNDNSEYI